MGDPTIACMTEAIADQARAPRRFGGLGTVPALLLVAAAVHLATTIAAQASIGEPWLLEPAIVIGRLTEVMSFVTAAAVVFGSERWPGGHGWLLSGALVLALQGVLDIALQAWTWWALSPGAFALAELDQTFAYVRGVAALLTTVAAPALLAAGILASPATASGNRTRRRAVAVLALLGLAALVAGVALAVAVSSRSPVPAFDVGYFALSGIGLAGLAGLGASAVHRLPAHYRMPELLIGVGAGLAVANGVWQSTVYLYWVLQGFAGSFGWLQTLPNALGLIGLVAVALGFAAGRIVPPRHARAPERRW
jgi:hypothetical protein